MKEYKCHCIVTRTAILSVVLMFSTNVVFIHFSNIKSNEMFYFLLMVSGNVTEDIVNQTTDDRSQVLQSMSLRTVYFIFLP